MIHFGIGLAQWILGKADEHDADAVLEAIISRVPAGW